MRRRLTNWRNPLCSTGVLLTLTLAQRPVWAQETEQEKPPQKQAAANAEESESAPPEKDSAEHAPEDAKDAKEPKKDGSSEASPADEPPPAEQPQKDLANSKKDNEDIPIVSGKGTSTESEGDLSAGLDDLSVVDLLQLDLRVASTKTNTTVQASPASVTVISREDIERYGYRSVADALRDVVGTHFVDDHITPNLGVRGVPGVAYEGSGTVKVMIDGVPVPFRTTGENWLGPALVPMGIVERIEIIKGPTSSLYGANAFLGVINVITRDNESTNWGEVGVTGMMTTNGKPGAHVEAVGGITKRPYRFNLGVQFDQENRSGLPMPSSSPAPRLAPTATDESRSQILRSGVATMNFTYRPTRKTTHTLTGRYARQFSAAEYAPWLQFTNGPGIDTGTQISLQQGTMTLKSASSLSKEFHLEAIVTGFGGSTLPNDRIDTGDSLAVVHRDLSYFGGEGTIEAIWEPVDPLRFVLGVEGTADREHLGAADYQDRDDGGSLPSVGTADDFEATLYNVAARAQLTWDIIPEYLVPTGGLRFDYNSVIGDKLSGRVAIVSRVMPDLYLKAAYGTAFQAPSPLLLYGSPIAVGDVIGSPELGAQEMRAWEFSADYRRKSVLDAVVTVTAWNLIDRAVFIPEQLNLVARNAGDAQGWTVEAETHSRFSDQVGGSLGFEWTGVIRDNEEDGYRGDLFGDAAEIYPTYVARSRVWTHPQPLPLEFWTAAVLVGPRNASDSNTLEAGERYQLPAYVTWDLGVRTMDLRWFGDRLTEFSLRGQNIVNSAGVNAGFYGIDYPAAPPKVLLEVRQEL